MAEPRRRESDKPDLQHQITEIAAALAKASPESIDEIIEGALADAGERLSADRCTLYLFDQAEGRLEFGCGWVRPGVTRLPLQGIDSVPADKLFPWCLKQLLNRQTIALPDVLEPPTEEAAADAERLAKLDVRSLMLAPMFAGELPVGLIGVDRAAQACVWSDGQRLFLEQVGAFLTQSLLRIKAERAVAEGAARYTALTEHNQSILFELSPAGLYTFVAPNAEAATGYRAEELVGQPFDCVLVPEDARRIAREFSSVLRDQRVLPVYEYRVRHKDGSELWHRSIVAPVRDHAGRVSSLVCNALDVTVLKQAEAELRRETDLTAILVRLATDYINLPLEELDAAIGRSLSELGCFVEADRAYVFTYDLSANVASNTHEWCAEGIARHIDDLASLSLVGLEDFVKPHLRGEMLYIPDVSTYSHRSTREILERQDIRSLITMPMMHGAECVGFVGFDSVHGAREYSPGEMRLLQVFTQMLVNMQIRTRAQLQLEQEQQRLADIVDGTDAGTWEWDQQTQEMRFNERWAKMVGHVSSETLPRYSMDWMAHVHPEDLQPAIDALVAHLKNQSPHLEMEIRVRHLEGHWIWLLLRGRVVSRDERGRALLVSGIAIDISEKKQTEADLRLSASVFTHSHEGILITDLEGRIIDVNQSFSRITGYAREEVLGKNPRLLSSGRQSPEFYQRMWETIARSGFWSGEVWNRRRDGLEYAQRLTISTVRDGDGQPIRFVGLFSDITTQKQYQQNLERLAHFDALTGLPNRVLMGDRIRQAMSMARRHGQRLALAYIDIDHFKLINNAYGQSVGDKVLQAMAARLGKVLRETDTTARPGGDEFAVILTDLAGGDSLDATLNRLVDVVGKPLKIGRTTVNLTVSVGVTTYPQSGELEGDQLLRQADQAMYEAKRMGRNSICYFDAELERSHQERQANLRRLREAFGQREFVLHYQPKVNLRTGRLEGLEALIRWQHPQRGLLAPAEFLPIIEGDELAYDLGGWVLSAALDDLARWRRGGLELGVAVNVSAGELLRGDFVERLRRELAERPDLSPGSLILEVVETSMLEDTEKANQMTRACADLGVQFALDDFGTGFSSLSHLKHLPIRQLKIDKSFVLDMLRDPDDLAIIEGVIRLGQAFGMEVLAEGVETDEHALALLNLGCELAQGYRVARPMSAAAVPAWIEAWQAPFEWSATPCLDSDLLPLLFAEAECQARLTQIEMRFESGSSARTKGNLRLDRSRFRHWLEDRCDSDIHASVWQQFRAADDLGTQVQHLMDSHDLTGAQQELERLRGLVDAMVAELRRLRAAAGDASSSSE